MPPTTATSAAVKSADDSLSANESGAVLPARRKATSQATCTVGATVSSVNAAVATGETLPATSACTAVTPTAPSPSRPISSATSATGCGKPLPASVRVTVPRWPVNVTAIVAAASPVTVSAPAAASAAVTPPAAVAARATTGAAGAPVSSVNDSAAAGLGLSARRLCRAVTTTSPSPSRPISAASSAIACGPPVPTSVRATLPPTPANVTASVAPASPVTVTTPDACPASARVAPPSGTRPTPAPSARSGAAGAGSDTPGSRTASDCAGSVTAAVSVRVSPP